MDETTLPVFYFLFKDKNNFCAFYLVSKVWESPLDCLSLQGFFKEFRFLRDEESCNR